MITNSPILRNTPHLASCCKNCLPSCCHWENYNRLRFYPHATKFISAFHEAQFLKYSGSAIFQLCLLNLVHLVLVFQVYSYNKETDSHAIKRTRLQSCINISMNYIFKAPGNSCFEQQIVLEPNQIYTQFDYEELVFCALECFQWQISKMFSITRNTIQLISMFLFQSVQ